MQFFAFLTLFAFTGLAIAAPLEAVPVGGAIDLITRSEELETVLADDRSDLDKTLEWVSSRSSEDVANVCGNPGALPSAIVMKLCSIYHLARRSSEGSDPKSELEEFLSANYYRRSSEGSEGSVINDFSGRSE